MALSRRLKLILAMMITWLCSSANVLARCLDPSSIPPSGVYNSTTQVPPFVGPYYLIVYYQMTSGLSPMAGPCCYTFSCNVNGDHSLGLTATLTFAAAVGSIKGACNSPAAPYVVSIPPGIFNQDFQFAACIGAYGPGYDIQFTCISSHPVGAGLTANLSFTVTALEACT